MFDQVKSEVVLPHIGAFSLHKRGHDAHCRRLPHGEIGLFVNSGRFEICIPVHARRLAFEVTALPEVVLFEDISGMASGAKACAIRLSSE